MRALPRSAVDVRMEAVTNAFVAAGVPDGIHDLGRLLEQLNAGQLGNSLELQDATLRPLYRAARPLQLNAPIVVRREQIIFCNFEGPHFMRGAAHVTQNEVPVLLLAPPFQIRGAVNCAPDADRTQSLRTRLQQFFVVTNARVYDAEGNELGEGEQIIVNGAAVQMISATSLHIPSVQIRTAPIIVAQQDDEEEEDSAEVRVA